MWWATIAWAGAPMPQLGIPEPTVDLAMSRICLDSGLQIWLRERPQAGVVTVTTVIGGGDSAETDATRGAAHLLEHLWFRSRPGAGPEVDDLLQPGVDANGFTLRDATVFATIGAPQDLDALLRLEVERLQDPLQGVDAAVLATEERVVHGELVGRDSIGWRSAERAIDHGLWSAGHPYAGSGAGDRTDFGLDTLRAYAASSYRPERTLIRIEGAVTGDQLIDALARVLPNAQRASGCVSHPPAAEVPGAPTTPGLVRIGAPVWRPQVVVGWSLPPGWGKTDIPAIVLLDVLEESIRDGLVFVRGVHSLDHLLQTDVGCWYDRGVLGSEVTCSVEVPTDADLDGVFSQVISAGGRLGKSTDNRVYGDLPSVRGEVYDGVFRDLDRLDPDALADRAMATWVGQLDPVEPVVHTVFQVQQTELTEFAARWLAPERAVGAALVPTAPAADSVADVHPALAEPTPPSWHPVRPALGEVVASEVGSGLETWVVQRPDAPYVARSGLVHTGGWATTPWAGANDLLDYGWYVDGLDYGELNERYATSARYRFGSRSSGFWVMAPAGNLDLEMWLLDRSVQGARVDIGSLGEDAGRDLRWAAAVFRDRPDLVVDELRWQLLLPDDRLADAWWDRARQAGTVSRGKGLRWLGTLDRVGASHLVVVGPVDAVVAQGLAGKYLGTWKDHGAPVAPLATPLPPAPPRSIRSIEYPAVVSRVATSCRVPARTDQNAAAFAVLDAALQRELWGSVRVGQGAYYVDDDLAFPDGRTGVLTLEAEVAPVLDSDTLDAMLDRIGRLRAGMSALDLDRARDLALRGHAVALASASSTWDTLTQAATEGRTLEGVRGMPAAIDRVDAQAVADLLADCAGHEVATVVGPGVSVRVAGTPVDWASYGGSLSDSLR